MLHIPDDIRSLGSSWVYWCFVMERFCGSLLLHTKSRSNPYPGMTKRMLEGVQISQIKRLYPELKHVLERPLRAGAEGSEGQEPTTMHETTYPECEPIIHFRLLTDPYTLMVPVKSRTPYYVVRIVQISASLTSYWKNL
jgi:hypothetical protein